MKLALVAVGQRQPAWADTACDEYLRRFPPDLKLELKVVKTEPRTQGRTVDALKAVEAQRLEALCGKGMRRVALDERGTRFTTQELAARLSAWQRDGRDVALLLGGPDGLDERLKSNSDETLRLSDLTLPHALARVLLVEALYRAWSLNAGHPYHRD